MDLESSHARKSAVSPLSACKTRFGFTLIRPRLPAGVLNGSLERHVSDYDAPIKSATPSFLSQLLSILDTDKPVEMPVLIQLS